MNGREKGTMTNEHARHGYAGISLLSMMLTAVVITINHAYKLGPMALFLGAVLVAVQAAFWWWFRQTQSRFALAGYVAMNVWVVAGFGLFKGLWKTVIPLVTGAPRTGSVGIEITGVLTLVGGLVVAYTASRFIAEARAIRRTQVGQPVTRHAALRARSAAMLLIILTGAWIGSSRSSVRAEAPIKIGVVAATRGPAGLLGRSFLNSIRLSKEEQPGTRHQYDLAIEEIPSPDQAEPAIRKLIKTDKVNALIVAMSMSGEIIKPYAAAAKIPFFCICSVGTLGDELYT